MGGKFVSYYRNKELSPQNSISGTRFSVRTFASRKSMKKSRKEGKSSKSFTLQTKETLPEDNSVLADTFSTKEDDDNQAISVNSALQDSIAIPSRSNVLQACTITSGLIAALGIIVRQVSHVGSMEGLPILDCSMEELLFRGALLPVFGFDWKSILVVSTLFGVLHIGNGRKYSFAVWATFVGIVYGYATIISSSLIVPMASHALNNLVGGILWRYSSKSLEE